MNQAEIIVIRKDYDQLISELTGKYDPFGCYCQKCFQASERKAKQ